MGKTGNNCATQCKMIRQGLNSLIYMCLRMWGSLKKNPNNLKSRPNTYFTQLLFLRYFCKREVKVFIFLFSQNNCVQLPGEQGHTSEMSHRGHVGRGREWQPDTLSSVTINSHSTASPRPTRDFDTRAIKQCFLSAVLLAHPQTVVFIKHKYL